MIYREFALRSPASWKALTAFVKANHKAVQDRGGLLRIIVSEDERTRNSAQNSRYWKLLSVIAESAWIDGQQFSKDVWHEHLTRLYLPLHEVILPTGEIVLIRATTTKLTVPDFSEYMDKIEAYAATELGVEFL